MDHLVRSHQPRVLILEHTAAPIACSLGSAHARSAAGELKRTADCTRTDSGAGHLPNKEMISNRDNKPEKP